MMHDMGSDLHDSEGDGAAVGSAAPSSQLVKNDQGTVLELEVPFSERLHIPVGCVAKNRRGLKHFDHERALSKHDFVAGSNASEYSVDNGQPEMMCQQLHV